MRSTFNLHSLAFIGACTSLAFATQSHAQTWDSAVFTFADCDPSSSSTGQAPGSPKSCSNSYATAHSETTFTSMKATVSTTSAAPNGSYFAGNIIQDSVVVNATDANLTGTNGFLRFSATLDGSLTGDTRLYFQALAYSFYAPGNSWSGSYLNLTTDLFGSTLTTPVINYATTGSESFAGTVSWELPVVFGSASNYSIGLTIYANAANATADFGNTFKITGVDAYNASGQAVAANFTTGSGTMLAPVPEPETYALMLAGLGVVGWAARRKPTACAEPATA